MSRQVASAIGGDHSPGHAVLDEIITLSPRRRFRRPAAAPVLEPATFVRRMSVKAGSWYARSLIERAFAIVEDSGDPAPWIDAVVRARDAGILARDIAWFLIYKFGEFAMFRVIETDPKLVTLTARVDAIQRAGGLAEDEFWHTWEGPPEWVEANREWERVHSARMADLLRDSGEPELTAAVARRRP